MAELLQFPQIANLDESSDRMLCDAAAPDAAARANALDIHRSFIVEAPAGSGKTGLLIQRYLKLLADASVTEPEQVLAITFTTKATAEMHNRVLGHLLEASVASESSPTRDSFGDETRLLARAVLARDQALGWDLLAHPHRLKIRTIDSVCAEIARTLPILSGSGGRLRPTADADPLYRQAARRTLLLLGGADDALDRALRDLLLHRDGNLANCESLIAEMLCLRDQWGDLVPLTHAQLDDAYLDANVLPRLERALEYAICVGLTKLTQIVPADFLAELTSLASEFAHLERHEGNTPALAFCANLQHPPGATADHLEHWRVLIHLLVTRSSSSWRKGLDKKILGFKIEKYDKARLLVLIQQVSHRDDLLQALCKIDSLPDAKYPAGQWSVAKSLFRVLSRALVELQLVFAEQNECDFTELSLLARHALGSDSGPEDLAAAAGSGLQHLLVDEMQDTSTTQYHLIQLLTEAWDGYSQTVFLVGDPRQSIYLFRQARVERFLHTMHTGRLGDLPLTHLRLSANFRSQRALVEGFNQDFALIFPEGDASSSQSAYHPADPVLPASAALEDLTWHVNAVPQPNAEPQPNAGPEDMPAPSAADPLSAADLRQRQAIRDANHIRRIAHRWLVKPLPAGRRKLPDGTAEPWRIAVLVRGRAHLAEIVTAFKVSSTRQPVPYRAVDIDALHERQEILDLTALTRALLHPGDRVATLAVLRAPWCGLSLADLHLLTGGDDSDGRSQSIERLMKDRGHLLPDEACERLGRVWHVLSEAAVQRARLTTSQLVERAWRSLGGDLWLTAPEIANTRRFFHLIDELEAASGGRIDAAILVDRLRFLYAEPAQFPPHIGFVDLLTIHNAKGLEWDVVFVPALERRMRGSSNRLLTWSELDPAGESEHESFPHVMLAPIAARGDEADRLTRWLRALQGDREAAERKRLFYVACTRAREELHLFAAPQTSKQGELKPVTTSLLDAAWSAAQVHLGSLKQELRPVSAIPAHAAVPASSSAVPATLDIAAGAESAPVLQPMLYRLPLHFTRPAALPPLFYGEPGTGPPTEDNAAPFLRPEGSFAARSFGSAVHTFLELLAARLQSGQAVASLLEELATWGPRIAAVLRADGLPPAAVDRFARETRSALEETLRDPDGLWILTPRAGSEAELALTAWQHHPSRVRIDRTFHAGASPQAAGEDYLWIVDFKTTRPGNGSIEDFLRAQQAAYSPQLEAYAAILAPLRLGPAYDLSKVRLALYYPILSRLVWWEPLPSFRLT